MGDKLFVDTLNKLYVVCFSNGNSCTMCSEAVHVAGIFPSKTLAALALMEAKLKVISDQEVWISEYFMDTHVETENISVKGYGAIGRMYACDKQLNISCEVKRWQRTT